MCIPQIAAIRNNLVSTDKSAFVSIPLKMEMKIIIKKHKKNT